MKSATSNANKAFKGTRDDRSASESSDEGQAKTITSKAKAKANSKAKAKGTAVKKSKTTTKSTAKSNAKVVKNKAAPKRPQNSYQAYLATEQPRVKAANPDWTRKEVFDFVRDTWHTAKPAKAAGRRKTKLAPPVQEDSDETEDEPMVDEADTMADIQPTSDTTAGLASALDPLENEVSQEDYNPGIGNQDFQVTDQHSLEEAFVTTDDIPEGQQQYPELADLESQVPDALPSYEEAVQSVETSVAMP